MKMSTEEKSELEKFVEERKIPKAEIAKLWLNYSRFSEKEKKVRLAREALSVLLDPDRGSQPCPSVSTDGKPKRVRPCHPKDLARTGVVT